jgi:uncharacterized protein
MIVDCHTHIWETPQQLGRGNAEYLRRQTGRAPLASDPASHLAAAECVNWTFVLGFFSRHLGAEIPNRLVADHVARHPDRLIGLAGVDPMADDLADRLWEAAERPEFRGVTISPAAQAFHPANTRAARLYEFCSDKGLIVLVHQGMYLAGEAMMEFARPSLWDEVLRDFPKMRVILAGLGLPWADETITLLVKHANLWADIAGVTLRPWHAYNVLSRVYEYSVMDKLLFGSDFPFLTAGEAIETAYRLNEFTHGTRLPAIPREALRGVIERDALTALGLHAAGV